MRRSIVGLLSITAIIITLLGCSAIKRITRSSSGTEFTIQIQTNEANKQEIYDAATRMLESKIDAIGLEADVVKSRDVPEQLKVTVYGNQPLDAIRQTLFTIYRLELKKVVKTGMEPTTYPSEEAARALLKDGQEVLPIKRSYNTDAQKFLIVEKPAIINGNDIRTASPYSPDRSNYSIQFSLKPDAAVKFGDWTERNIGNYLAIIVNDEIQSYPVIKGKILDQGTIEGRFTKSSAEDLALGLKEGYLPASMTILNERHIGN
jgi:protein-export membrane protein SecD